MNDVDVVQLAIQPCDAKDDNDDTSNQEEETAETERWDHFMRRWKRRQIRRKSANPERGDQENGIDYCLSTASEISCLSYGGRN